MKKRLVTLLVVVAILCVGCSNQSNDRSEDVTVQDEPEEIKEEDDSPEEYQELQSEETFGPEVYFEITGELNRQEISDVDKHMNPDGTFSFYVYSDGGTPYMDAGPVYDHEMLSMQKYVLRPKGDDLAPGGSYVEFQYRFTPKAPGETELLMLSTYEVDDTYEGGIYHITIDEDLTCHLDWNATVKQGENMELIERSTEEFEGGILSGYKETMHPETFGEDVYFEIIGEVIQNEWFTPYSDTNQDGSLNLYLSETDGVPYWVEGPIYDHEMFDMQTYMSVSPSDSEAVGSGSIDYLYRFKPRHPGETEIVALSTYYVDNVYQGTVYHITVEEDLTCRIDWYADVEQGKNIEIIQSEE